MVDQVLDECAIALARLPAWPAVDPDQGGHLVLGRRLVRLVEDRRDRQTVGRLEADDLGVDEVVGIDLLAERVGQPRRLGRADLARVEVCRESGRRSSVTTIRCLVAREDDRSDVAFRQLGHRDKPARLRVVNADDGSAVVVDGRDAIASVAREPGELNVPVGRLDVFVLAGRQLVAPDAGELAARRWSGNRAISSRGRTRTARYCAGVSCGVRWVIRLCRVSQR